MTEVDLVIVFILPMYLHYYEVGYSLNQLISQPVSQSLEGTCKQTLFRTSLTVE